MNNNMIIQSTTSNIRSLGKGFGEGYAFPLYLQEDNYKPFRLPLSDLEQIRERILKLGQNTLTENEWATIIPDLLANGLDITRLIKRLPPIIIQLGEEKKSLFWDVNTLAKVDQRFLNTLAMTLPEKPQNIQEWSKLLSEKKMSDISPKMIAYLVPAILDQMSSKDKGMLATEIAQKLQEKDKTALVLPHFFDIQFIHNASQDMTIKNNGRSLQFFPEGKKKITVLFQDRVWTIDHAHIHFEKDGEEKEYKLYSTRAQMQDTENDPNKKIAGEVHNVFRRVTKTRKIKMMAIGFPLMINKVNPLFQTIIENIPTIPIPVGESVHLSSKVDFKETFMKNFSPEKVIYHSWGSFVSNTDAFEAGLRFSIIPEYIEISEQQYNQYLQVFGTLHPLAPEDALYPIDRKANFRPFIT